MDNQMVAEWLAYGKRPYGQAKIEIPQVTPLNGELAN
jgi:hypothetical protein